MVLRHEARLYSVAFSPDGERLVAASWDKTARVWNADGAGASVVLRGHESGILSASFSPDGKRIVTASADKTVRVWNADGSGEPVVLRGHDGVVSSAEFSPDGKRIVTASADKTMRVWNADGSGEPLVFRVSDFDVNQASFSPDGSRVVTACDDGLRVWSDLEPLHGVADPKLWTATTYCMPVERRMDLLHVPESTALADRDACLRHVEEARGAALRAAGKSTP
ncbi:MAG: hypothetical protein QM820_26895 [Minicystis sp.]